MFFSQEVGLGNPSPICLESVPLDGERGAFCALEYVCFLVLAGFLGLGSRGSRPDLYFALKPLSLLVLPTSDHDHV